MDVAGSKGPYVMLGCLFVMCATIGLFISNTATAVLMAPIARRRRNQWTSRLILCHGGGDGGFGGLYDAGLFTGKYAGAGTGKIYLQRFCEDWRAVHRVGDGGLRAARADTVSVLTATAQPGLIRIAQAGAQYIYSGESRLISSSDSWKLRTKTCIK